MGQDPPRRDADRIDDSGSGGHAPDHQNPPSGRPDGGDARCHSRERGLLPPIRRVRLRGIRPVRTEGAEAVRRAHLFRDLDLAWIEEPLPADDIDGHVRLARSTRTPIAAGESMYSAAQFREYLARGAAGIVQVDVARVGGITPWLKVAHLAETFNVDVCPRFLMELHVSLAAAVPNGRYVEHLPQLRAITHGELEIGSGHALAPEAGGLGIDRDRDAIDDRTVA